MKVLVLNPNSTPAMTRQIEMAARSAARPGTEIVATNPETGPASIQGYLDIAACMTGLLVEAEKYEDVDAVVVACFDDTGVDALRCIFDGPVLGIGEAAYHAASMISTRFSVVTTLSRSIPGLEVNISRYGFSARCCGIRATDIPVLELETDGATSLIEAEVEKAIEIDRAECIILGCAGMAELREHVSRKFNVPVIDGIASAVGFTESLVNAGLKTSKSSAYAKPTTN